MNRKKIIAREFLLFISCILISGLAFIGTYGYNFVIKSQIDKLEQEIIPLTNNIHLLEKKFKSKLSKQKWFYKEWENNSDLAHYEDYTVMWKRLEYLQKNDSIEFKWNNVWVKSVLDFTQSVGFKNPKQFDQFINDNTINDDDLKKSIKADSTRTEVSSLKSQIRWKKHKTLDINDQLDFMLLFFVIAVAIIFPIRFIFYAVKWSIKTLKQKE